MSDITIRKARFDFPETLDDIFPGDDPRAEGFLAAFSLTLPHLERGYDPADLDPGALPDLVLTSAPTS